MSKIAQKSPIFPPPVYLTPPMKGLPLEFGIGVRCPECSYDGAIRWSKKFSDTFSRFDTILAVTDSQPPSQPASHVAIAITLNAKASSLKSNNKTQGSDFRHDMRGSPCSFRITPIRWDLTVTVDF